MRLIARETKYILPFKRGTVGTKFTGLSGFSMGEPHSQSSGIEDACNYNFLRMFSGCFKQLEDVPNCFISPAWLKP